MEKRWVFGALASIVIFRSLSFVSAAFNFTDMLNMWANAGVFKYVLPFLLVFALVFGILSKGGILGDNKGVHAILAATLGLLSLVGDYFPNFLEKFAPNLATGVSVLLGAIILLGLFYKEGDNRKNIIWVLFGIGVIAFLLIITNTFSSSYGFAGMNIWQDYGPAIITLVILGIAVWAIISWKKD
jgi:hypothetical protein